MKLFLTKPRSEYTQKGTFFLKVCLQNLFHVLENTGAWGGIAPEEEGKSLSMAGLPPVKR